MANETLEKALDGLIASVDITSPIGVCGSEIKNAIRDEQLPYTRAVDTVIKNSSHCRDTKKILSKLFYGIVDDA